MDAREAKQVLLLYRPGSADTENPEVIQAIAVARRDPDLASWFQQHCAGQQAIRAKFREIEVPLHLKAALISGPRPFLRPRTWWRNPVWLAAAASILVLLGLAGVWLKPKSPERFANFRDRMLASALREYPMEIKTDNMRTLRQLLAARGAPANYELTRGLERLQLTGGAPLHWRGRSVSMVCLNRGDNQMLFLFVMKRSAVRDPPPVKPQISKFDELAAISWSSGDNSYLLAGPEEPGFLQKYH